MVLGKRTKEIVDWSRAPLLRRLKIRAVNILANVAVLTVSNIGGKLRA